MFQEDNKSITRFFIVLGVLSGIGILALIYAGVVGLDFLIRRWGG